MEIVKISPVLAIMPQDYQAPDHKWYIYHNVFREQDLHQEEVVVVEEGAGAVFANKILVLQREWTNLDTWATPVKMI